MTACACCGAALGQHGAPWLMRCATCGLRSSLLNRSEFNGSDVVGWDDAGTDAMAPVRAHAAARILDELDRAASLPSKRLLDVGCGPGWFLSLAGTHGFRASGIEVDARVAALGRAQGLEITTATFPGGTSGNTYDVITFNDVFEHLADPGMVLGAVRDALTEQGLLVLNLPSSEGIIYRVAEALRCLHIYAPLERMWQRGFESPHLFYYKRDNLTRMVTRYGFERILEFTLPSMLSHGLWGRIRTGRRMNAAQALAVYCCALCAIPMLRFLPADIIVQVYRRV